MKESGLEEFCQMAKQLKTLALIEAIPSLVYWTEVITDRLHQPKLIGVNKLSHANIIMSQDSLWKGRLSLESRLWRYRMSL